ncbi:hypothetical protein [Halomonas sp. Y3]
MSVLPSRGVHCCWARSHADLVALTGTYNNLVRMWSEC